MRNRTSCTQVQKLPKGHCGNNREGTHYFFYDFIYVNKYAHIYKHMPYIWYSIKCEK